MNPHNALNSLVQKKQWRDILQVTNACANSALISVPGPRALNATSADLEVVNAVEPIQRIRTCPLGIAAHGVHLCPLHTRLDNALAMVEEAFQNTTLGELLAEPTRSIPLCPFPN